MSDSCRNGHIRTAENTRQNPNGSRSCRICLRARARQRYEEELRATAPHQHIVTQPKKVPA